MNNIFSAVSKQVSKVRREDNASKPDCCEKKLTHYHKRLPHIFLSVLKDQEHETCEQFFDIADKESCFD